MDDERLKRGTYLIEKYATKIDADYVFTEDVLVSSPSAGAAFVGGTSISGNEVWKTEDGIPLKNLDC